MFLIVLGCRIEDCLLGGSGGLSEYFSEGDNLGYYLGFAGYYPTY